ncbi:MucBP domain-containing protein [Alloscardovia criceti]|uniref:MucBP domain-containing protein n=1 Tax=Alloscardovia criceti TaxID=356828 RepID=UPI000375DD74|nr:MucBP domain-containing protein [Alloscardovia criceti]
MRKGKDKKTLLHVAAAAVVSLAMLFAIPAATAEDADGSTPPNTVVTEKSATSGDASGDTSKDNTTATAKTTSDDSSDADSDNAASTTDQPAASDASASDSDTGADANASAAPVAHVSNVNAKAAAVDPSTLTEIWVNAAGSDDNDGSSADQAFATMAKALEVQKANTNIATINLSGDFGTWTAVTIPSGVTLNVVADTTITGTSGTAITLAAGSFLNASGVTLNIKGFATGVLVNNDAEINDGNYVLDGNGIGLNLQGKLNGTERSALTVSIVNSTGNGINWTAGARFVNATVEAAGKDGGDSQLYVGPTMVNSSLTTRNLWYYFDPTAGGIHMDHSDFYVYKSSGGSAKRNVFAILADSDLKNGSTLTGDGSRITVSAKFTVDDSKVVVKNSSMGGLNINYSPAEVIFNNSTLETSNISGFPSYGTAQSNGPAYLTFEGNSVINTDNKSNFTDNGGAYRSNGGTYVITGGSYLVKYDPNYNYNVTTPTNGLDNGDEYLSYFTLSDSSLTSFNPINKNGATYEYQVANASADGLKHVFTPAAKVTFKLNNSNAKFADDTTADKVQSTIRGYKLDFVTGTSDIGTPVDSTGVKFLGWYYKDDSGTEHAFSFSDTVFNADTEVYAKWDSKTVIYHNGAGTDYIQSIPASEDSATALTYEDVIKANEDFARPGKVFSKWTTAADPTSDEISSGSTLAFNDGVTQIDVYAQYTDNVYMVGFSANGGTFADSSIFKQNPDIFTVTTDPVLGGEIAYVTTGATYNQKLSEILGNFARGQITPKAAAATKTGSVLASDTYWTDSPVAGGSGIRFDDYSIWIVNIPGEDPSFTADTTYYLSWKDDPSVTTFPYEGNINSDMWGSSDRGQDTSTTALRVDATDGETFSLTGAVDVSAIKSQMDAIQGQFGGAEPEDIKLTGTTSTFTATMTLPDGVNAPSALDASQVAATGLGDLFEVKSAEISGKTLTVTLGLKHAYSTYAELKTAVFATGSQPQVAFRATSDVTNPISDSITLTVPGFSLDSKTVNNGDELTVTGTVKGTFNSVASTDAKAVRFNLTWNGTQIDTGKDFRAADDNVIQQTILVVKPMESNLPSDMLVYVQPDNATEDQQKQAGIDTTATAPAGVYQGSKVNLTGTIDAASVKKQMEYIEAQFGNPTDQKGIKLTDLSSEFTAKFTVPTGLTLPADLSTDTVIPEGFADTFAVSDVEVSGKTVTVTFSLKDGIENYAQLKTAIFALDDTMKLTVPNITVDEDVQDGQTLTIAGEVSGSFNAIATNANGTEKDFAFVWNGYQTEAGKDKGAADGVIQLTLATPSVAALDLPSDMLSGSDTEAAAVYPVLAGSTLPLTGAVRIDGIKKQMEFIEGQFGNPDRNTISVDIKQFGFTASMTLPDQMSLPEGLDTSKVIFDGDADTFEVTKVTVEGQKVTIDFGLKNQSNIKTYKQLKDAVDAAGVENGTWLKLTIPDVKVADDAPVNTNFTSVGTVSGYFKANATSQAGTTKAFSFKWDGTQWAEGKDAVTASDDERITFTTKVPNPQDMDLEGDLTIGDNTTKDEPASVYAGDTVNLTGKVHAKQIQEQMKAIEDQFNDPDGTSVAIDIQNFGFTAQLTLPEGVSYPAGFGKDNAVSSGFGDAFSIDSVSVDGQTATVKFVLTDPSSITDYAKLQEAVNGASEWMDITFNGLKVADDLAVGTVVTATGTVTGAFAAIATKTTGSRQVFNFAWNAVQWANGKDSLNTNDTDIKLSLKVIEKPAGTITVHYVDTAGNTIADPTTINGKAGDAYTVDTKAIDGYTYSGPEEGSAPLSGTIVEGNRDITLVYTKNPEPVVTGTVTVHYVDKDGNEIAEKLVLTGDEGAAYVVVTKSIDGYTYVGLAEGSGELSGTYREGNIDVTLVYTKNPAVAAPVTVKYVDEDGNEVAKSETLTGNVGDTYTAEQKTVEGYTYKGLADGSAALSGTLTSTAQTVVLVYTKNAEPVVTGTVTVHYVDKDGNVISDQTVMTGQTGSPYAVATKTIDGYTYVGLADGSSPLTGAYGEGNIDVTLVYSKNAEPVTPVEPEESGKPGQPEPPVVPVAPTNPVKTTEVKKLASTGSAVSAIVLAAVILAGAGVVLVMMRRRGNHK